jgi:hypothetical protein
MRDPQEWNEPVIADQLTHEHAANNYTWGENADGTIWQVGTCSHCSQDITRKSMDDIYTEWIVMP